MGIITNAPRGTADILPDRCRTWQDIEQRLRVLAGNYGMKEIRVPTFEHTELFQRSVGDTTDVVQKEMYTFQDKSGRSITLRPEGTAGTVRAVIENGLYNSALPLKLYYFANCFRYEKPQAGRMREFHQFGVEILGSALPAADAEVIVFAAEIIEDFALDRVRLELNSIGCKTCRSAYYETLLAYFSNQREQLCPTCRERLERNPMRILDCKNEDCRRISKDAPKIAEHLCKECENHFRDVQMILRRLGVAFYLNPNIVRGLDYYNRTVFEFVSDDIGAQGTILAGGRYDGLVEELGGPSLPALGFGMGIERLALLLEKREKLSVQSAECRIFIASIGEQAALESFVICTDLRKRGICAAFDTCGRSLKAQMKYADKLNASFTLVLGETELETREAELKNMKNGERTKIRLDRIAETVEQRPVSVF